MPYSPIAVKPDPSTMDEWRSVLKARLETLEEATRHASIEGHMPAIWRRGWKAYAVCLGRDRDGSLLACVTVRDPSGAIVRTRRLRLVKERRLNLG